VESAFSTMAQFRTGETDDVKGKGSDVPGEFALLQNFPNPFNPKTVINYQLPVNSYVALKVFDLLGREVATLVNEKKDVGRYSMQWDAGRCASGIYFYALQAGEFRETKKMILMK
jgi:hypothetical protein